MPHIDSLPHARPNLLDYSAVCKRLNICKQTFHNLADSGKLGQVYRIGTSKRVTELGVEAYLRSVCDVDEPEPIAPRGKRKKRDKKHCRAEK
ncbi:helix-turn-helix domain-containing protein [Humidesulfovibrio idahonensis]